MACNRLEYLRSRFQEIRGDIERRFEHVIHLVEQRKLALYQLLEDVMSEYEKKHDEFSDAIDLLESHKEQVSDSLDNNLLDDIVSQQLNQLNKKIAALRVEFKEPDINWKWNENQVNDFINSLGVLASGELNIANDIIVPDYGSMKMPTVCAVRRGKQMGEIWDPRGIAIDHRSGNIYVADYGANKVSVFSVKYNFLFQFGAEGGFGRMDGPHGINIFQDRVYVTQLNTHRVQIYTIGGRCTNHLGYHGSQAGEMIAPGDAFIDETNGEIYVCDSQNNRVQVFHDDLRFKKVFSRRFESPVRGKVHKNSVIILDHSNPCLHFYSKEGEFHRSLFHRELLTVAVRRFFDFELDSDSNIILTDVSLHCIVVANIRGKILHQFGSRGEKIEAFMSPWALALTKDGHIIVLCCNGFGCLKIF